LSHAETLAMFHRALARIDLPVEYSQGFNPHQKLSLPLPRSVGLEVDEDILFVRVKAGSFNTDDFKTRLAIQMPAGCEILEVAQSDTARRPVGAIYVLKVVEDFLDENLKNRIENILAQNNITLQRQIDEKGRIREVDVRPYLGAINVKNTCVEVQCIISPAGSIRVDEILKLLELDITKLAAPVRRVKINWQTN
jgi:radical SAM-linked protein